MNPIITALLIFGGTVQVIADLIVIDKAFGKNTAAAVRAIVLSAKERRRRAAFVKRAKANFEIWRRADGRQPGSTFDGLPRNVREALGMVTTNELSLIELNIDGNDLDVDKFAGRK